MAAWEESKMEDSSLGSPNEYFASGMAGKAQEDHHVELHRGLKARHITMIGKWFLFYLIIMEA
jgi:amino acid permease